jgi:hypothetical protein
MNKKMYFCLHLQLCKWIFGRKKFTREANLFTVRGWFCRRVASCSALMVVKEGGGTAAVKLFSGLPDDVTV